MVSSGCKGKVVRATDVMGECSRCKMKVKISRCRRGATANVVFEADNGAQKNLVIFDEQLKIYVVILAFPGKKVCLIVER